MKGCRKALRDLVPHSRGRVTRRSTSPSTRELIHCSPTTVPEEENKEYDHTSTICIHPNKRIVRVAHVTDGTTGNLEHLWQLRRWRQAYRRTRAHQTTAVCCLSLTGRLRSPPFERHEQYEGRGIFSSNPCPALCQRLPLRVKTQQAYHYYLLSHVMSAESVCFSSTLNPANQPAQPSLTLLPSLVHPALRESLQRPRIALACLCQWQSHIGVTCVNNVVLREQRLSASRQVEGIEDKLVQHGLAMSSPTC